MSDQSLYDEDILLWSEQQADVIRRLGRARRDIPNELDIENVAEEIESVGRSELAAVESRIRLIFVHLMKLLAEPQADAVLHWQAEIVGFHADMERRYSRSMRQRINLDHLWRRARDQSILAYRGAQHDLVLSLPKVSPVTLDDLLGDHIDVVALVEGMREAIRGQDQR